MTLDALFYWLHLIEPADRPTKRQREKCDLDVNYHGNGRSPTRYLRLVRDTSNCHVNIRNYFPPVCPQVLKTLFMDIATPIVFLFQKSVPLKTVTNDHYKIDSYDCLLIVSSRVMVWLG